MQNELNSSRCRRMRHPLVVALRAVFARHRDAVLHAPTGAGKSTLVPLALLHEEFVGGRKILMLEPRRLAARAVAARMASLARRAHRSRRWAIACGSIRGYRAPRASKW